MNIRMILIALLFSVTAFAGSLTVRDTSNWITSADRAAIATAANASPFEVHIIVEDAPSPRALETDARALVDSPKALVIAIDPAHHKTVTRFGSGTRVKTGDFDNIAAAGNTYFRNKEVGPGLSAIINRATASAQSQALTLQGSDAPVPQSSGSSTLLWVGAILVLCLIVGFVIWMVRKIRRDREDFEQALRDSEQALLDNRLETSELLSRNINASAEADFDRKLSKKTRTDLDLEELESFGRNNSRVPAQAPRAVKEVPRTAAAPRTPAPVYRQPAPVYAPPAPVYVQPAPVYVNNHSSDLVTGMLLNEAMHSHSHREVVVEREVVHEKPSSGGSSFWDSGSSSSSSDSGSSFWGSGDSGGSSSWDSGGGGGDFGGGGDSSW